MRTELPTRLQTQATKLVTAAAATDLFSSTAHGFVAGDSVRFPTKTAGAGVTVNTDYYVIASGLATDAFRVSATRGGATIDVTTDMTAGTVVRTENWANLKVIFNNGDLGELAKYWQNSQKTDLADGAVFDRTVLQDFYLNRRLPA